jgi:phosphatidylinositol-binding clathrin assembly protein
MLRCLKSPIQNFINLSQMFYSHICRGVQWNSPKNSARPGAAHWTPQPMAATTGAGYKPMVSKKFSQLF